MKKIGFFLLFWASITSCNSPTKLEEEISRTPVNVELIRFDKAFGNANVKDISQLKEKYPLFFSEQYPDSIWTNRMQDEFQKELFKEVVEKFPSEASLVEDFGALFQHIKYYFPSFNEPIIYTLISDVDYRSKILEKEGVLVIGLDNYLGADNELYQGIAKYITKNMKPERLIPDLAALYAKKHITLPKQKTLLSEMIYHGKILYLKDIWLASTANEVKIGYTEEELKWANDNESDIWRYFVEREALFSTNKSLSGRFIKPAPFSKFRLELDNESPGMIGRYIGWQIVKSFMKNTDTSLGVLLQMESEDIFKKSKYKPKK